jgi:hypothetical protein
VAQRDSNPFLTYLARLLVELSEGSSQERVADLLQRARSDGVNPRHLYLVGLNLKPDDWPEAPAFYDLFPE